MQSTLTGKASASRWRMSSEYSEGEKDLYMGKGGTGGRSPQRKLLLDTQGRSTGANLTAGNSKSGRASSDTEASPTEEPCEGKLHAGICAGGAGRPAFLPRRPTVAFERTKNTGFRLNTNTHTDVMS